MMPWRYSVKPFKILPKIEVSPLFVLLLCAYFYFDPERTFLPFVLAILTHEGAHLLVLAAFGVPVHKISFALNGAVISARQTGYGKEIFVAAAGPLVNLILLLCFCHTFPRFALMNFCLFLYNLLPFYPLDGGRIIRCLLHLILEEGSARRVETIVRFLGVTILGAGTWYLTCVWHAGLWPVLLFAVLLLRVTGEISPGKKPHKFNRLQLTNAGRHAKINKL